MEGRGGEGGGEEGRELPVTFCSSSTICTPVQSPPLPDEFEESDKVAAGDCVQGLDSKPHRGRVPHSGGVLGQPIEDVPTR